jgi:Domain of unknown function (DUF4360)
MKHIKALLVLITVITAPIAPALAQVGYGGNGCPAGSSSATVSPDGQELSILFDKFIALGNTPGQSRKSCNISMPIQVPQGFQAALDSIDYQGYVAANTKGTLQADYFFAGKMGTPFKRTINGEKNYNIKDAQTTQIWSKCGAKTSMSVNVSMLAEGAGKATIDKSPVLHFKYRPCN